VAAGAWRECAHGFLLYSLVLVGLLCIQKNIRTRVRSFPYHRREGLLLYCHVRSHRWRGHLAQRVAYLFSLRLLCMRYLWCLTCDRGTPLHYCFAFWCCCHLLLLLYHGLPDLYAGRRAFPQAPPQHLPYAIPSRTLDAAPADSGCGLTTFPVYSFCSGKPYGFPSRDFISQRCGLRRGTLLSLVAWDVRLIVLVHLNGRTYICVNLPMVTRSCGHPACGALPVF